MDRPATRRAPLPTAAFPPTPVARCITLHHSTPTNRDFVFLFFRDFVFLARGVAPVVHGGVRLGAREFVEVHVSTSLQTCEERDPKNLYKKVSTPITTIKYDRTTYGSCAMVWFTTMLYTSQMLHCQLRFVLFLTSTAYVQSNVFNLLPSKAIKLAGDGFCSAPQG